jgi:hypothetical protein
MPQGSRAGLLRMPLNGSMRDYVSKSTDLIEEAMRLDTAPRPVTGLHFDF